jgi:hypothetical protein
LLGGPGLAAPSKSSGALGPGMDRGRPVTRGEWQRPRRCVCITTTSRGGSGNSLVAGATSEGLITFSAHESFLRARSFETIET